MTKKQQPSLGVIQELRNYVDRIIAYRPAQAEEITILFSKLVRQLDAGEKTTKDVYAALRPFLSIVRSNLLEQEGYSPYCGDPGCSRGMPRTHWNGKQFECGCGFETSFDPEFIAVYKRVWGKN